MLRTRGTIEHGADGKPVQILGISQDITELHAADKRAQVRLMQMARRALDREERERSQLVKDLREHVTEPLVGLGRRLATLNSSGPASEAGPVAAQIDECIRRVKAAAAATLQVMGHLRPSVLEEHGLLAALRAEALRVGRQAAIPVSVCGDEISPRLPPGTETALFRLAREAIANAARHSNCTLASFRLSSQPGTGSRITVDYRG